MLRISGEILAKVMRQLCKIIKEDVVTLEIDKQAEELILAAGCAPAFKGYNGFPASVCTSINEEIVHGIPSERIIKDGDIISLDIGVDYKGFFSDAAVTLAIGQVDKDKRKLIEITRNALDIGIKQARAENRLTDISHSIQDYVERNGFSVVRQFVGHGIGLKLHEEPEIPNFGLPHQGPVLKNGMVLAIEPMVNMGTWESEILDNGWTAVTKDRLPSAHFEHTVAITEEGPKILTS